MYANAQEPSVSGRAGTESRYVPPTKWARIAVRDLLLGSPRETLSEKQLSLLASVTSHDHADAWVYVAGDTSLLRRRCIAVVGSRKVSPEGGARARRVARELVAADVVVVSGLAEGVDAEAMTSAIRHGGRTVGVIGTPLDQAYPAKNRRLHEEVYRNHLLVSQFEFGSRVFRSNFPGRNRLMALLSDATVVIEASDTSGALHQATECTRIGRWLFIAKSVVENSVLQWPARFLSYERCRVLESTDDILSNVYGSWPS